MHRQKGVSAARASLNLAVSEVGDGRVHAVRLTHSSLSGLHLLPSASPHSPHPFSLWIVSRFAVGSSPELVPVAAEVADHAVTATLRPSKHNSRHDLTRASAVDSRHRRRLPCPLGEFSVHLAVAGAAAPLVLGRRRWRPP